MSAGHEEKYNPAHRHSRSPKSVKKRSKTVTKEFVVCASCVAKVSQVRRNGLINVDRMMVATALHSNRIVSTPTDDCGPEFRFLSLRIKLKDHPEFMNAEKWTQDKHTPVAPALDEVEDVSSAPDTGESDQSEVTSRPSRPIGKRWADDLSTKKELTRNKIKVAEQLLVAQQKWNNVLHQRSEVLLSTSTQSTSEDSKLKNTLRLCVSVH